ncbi:hypothetical protein PUN28_003895 [Cardiocondyla obscurior]|uniref:Uncharacterized protein n=1 Tax=Cardiocondyla obscurior TaxID=286306 RepID=A0AAW2GNJ4_9HYME
MRPRLFYEYSSLCRRVSSPASAEFSNSQGCIDDAGRRHGNIFDVTRRPTERDARRALGQARERESDKLYTRVQPLLYASDRDDDDDDDDDTTSTVDGDT